MNLTSGQIVWIFVTTLGIFSLALAWRFGRRYGLNPIQFVLFAATWLATRVYWRTRYVSRWPLDYDRGAVCICNHTSSLDSFFPQMGMPKLGRWMVAKEYFTGLMGWFLRYARAIPVKRSSPDAATKAAIGHAKRGGIVGMFPEGRINTTDEVLLPARPGAVLVALKAGVPIVPCHIAGVPYFGTPMSSFRRPARVRVTFGQPIDLSGYGDADDKETLAEITLRCMKELARLAGEPEFEPKLAGRHWAKEIAAESDQRDAGEIIPATEDETQSPENKSA